ncbi:hypothetical protein NOVO_04890 [Rickettsiales bacterium Ac37b]|nr:hypothetical protein NOVO_04890 [Rickettsiales bacterium Ac37b]
MNILNILADIQATHWNLDPISHLDKNGKVKSMEEYRKEAKPFLRIIEDGHADLLKNAQLSLVEKVCNKVGTIFSGKYSFSQFTNDIYSEELSPVSHYNAKGQLKTQTEFNQDLKRHMIDKVYPSHREFIDYENSTYTELVCTKTGQSISNLCYGKVFSALGHGVEASIYFMLGVTNVTCKTIYNVSNTSYKLTKNIVSKLHSTHTKHNDMTTIDQYDNCYVEDNIISLDGSSAAVVIAGAENSLSGWNI